MATTVESGYLGSLSIESGAGISRQPTMANGNPIYNPFAECAWADELIGADGRYRFLTAGNVTAPTADMHNYNDALTVITLLRMKPQIADWGPVIGKSGGGLGWYCSEIDGQNGYYVRIDTSAGANQGNYYNAQDMRQLTDRNWHWFAFSLNAGAYRRYLNGAALASASGYQHGTGLANSGLFRVACDSSSQTQVACVLIYDRALSDTEVAQIVAGKVKPKSVPNLRGYYKFNEAVGTTGACTDYSGNGNHMNYSADVLTLTEQWSPDGNLVKDPGCINPAAWIPAAGTTIGGGKISMNLPASNIFVRQQPFVGIIQGNTYRVTYEIRNYVSGQARIRLHGVNGCNALTSVRSGNGTYTEDIVPTGSGAAPANCLGIVAVSADCVMEITNISVVRLYAGADGASGMPFVRRQQFGITGDTGNLFRSPPSLPSYRFQGCVVSGGADVVTVPDSPSLQVIGDMTMAGWVKLQLTGSTPLTVMNKSTANEGRFDLTQNGKILSLTRGGVTTTQWLNKPIPSNVWAHLAVACAYGFAFFYVNGTLAGVKAFAPLVTASTSPLGLGAITSGRRTPSRSMRLFNRALSGSEINALFQTDTYANADGAMVGEWLCNEPWNTVMRDTSGWGNHALPTGCIRLLDSPYCVPRRKRVGKQLSMSSGSHGILHSSAALRTLLVGSRVITLVGWMKLDQLLVVNGQRFGFNTSATNAGVIMAGNGSFGSLAAYARADPTGVAGYIITPQAMTPRGVWTLYALEADFTAKTLSYFVNGMKAVVQTDVGFSLDAYTDPGNPFLYLSLGNGTANMRADAMRLYNRQLSLDEHYGLFLDMAPRDGLVAEYLFDNDPGYAADSSGNGLHASVLGGTPYVSHL